MGKTHDDDQNPEGTGADDLLTLKRRISQRYLGKAGIHAVGVHQTDGAIAIYYKPDADAGQDALLQQIKDEALPYKLITVPEAPATLYNASTPQEENKG